MDENIIEAFAEPQLHTCRGICLVWILRVAFVFAFMVVVYFSPVVVDLKLPAFPSPSYFLTLSPQPQRRWNKPQTEGYWTFSIFFTPSFMILLFPLLLIYVQRTWIDIVNEDKQALLAGLVDVIIYSSPDDKKKNRLTEPKKRLKIRIFGDGWLKPLPFSHLSFWSDAKLFFFQGILLPRVWKPQSCQLSQEVNHA